MEYIDVLATIKNVTDLESAISEKPGIYHAPCCITTCKE